MLKQTILSTKKKKNPPEKKTSKGNLCKNRHLVNPRILFPMNLVTCLLCRKMTPWQWSQPKAWTCSPASFPLSCPALPRPLGGSFSLNAAPPQSLMQKQAHTRRLINIRELIHRPALPHLQGVSSTWRNSQQEEVNFLLKSIWNFLLKPSRWPLGLTCKLGASPQRGALWGFFYKCSG